MLGLMFKADSRVCGEILGLTAEAYRQRLSRIRKKVAAFLGEYCGLSGTGTVSYTHLDVYKRQFIYSTASPISGDSST